ncbi:MAG TPA: hypothetical protein VEC93_09950 [Anaerolineae bacterium]|nr:hypothetical protein [Anaerolineae bacterium]
MYKGKKGHSSGEKQVALLAQVQALLPEGAKVILTGDAEFDGPALISWLQAQATWDYVCRTAKNSQIRASKSVDWHALADIAPVGGESRQFNNLYFTRQEVASVNLAFIWNEKEAEHLYLVSSAETLSQSQD